MKYKIYELLIFLWPFKKGKSFLQNYLIKTFRIGPYGFYKRKKVGSYNLFLDPGDQNDLHYYFNNVGDGYKEILIKLISTNDVIIDIGVNVGYFSALAAEAVGANGTVYAIEASPIMINRLNKMLNESKINTIKLFNYAIWKDKGTLEFKVATNSGWSSIIENPTFIIDEKFDVNAITLDQFCEDQSINKINLLKLDIEGAEMDALLGSIELFTKNRIELILLEVEPFRLNAYNHSGIEINNFFSKFGYTALCTIEKDQIFKISDSNKIPGNVNSDYLYVRNDMYDEKFNLLWK